jgi:hypothetical protein
MSPITDPVKLEEARARMARARAARVNAIEDPTIERRLGTVRALVLQQFKDAALSPREDGDKLGFSSPAYLYNKLRKGNLNLWDMIVLGDYLPIDWTAVFKAVRQPKEVLRPVDTTPQPVRITPEPQPGPQTISADPFASYFTEVD